MPKHKPPFILIAAALALLVVGCGVTADETDLQPKDSAAFTKPAVAPVGTKPPPTTSLPPSTEFVPSPSPAPTETQPELAAQVEASPTPSQPLVAEPTRPEILPTSLPPMPPAGPDVILIYGLAGAREAGSYAEAVTAAVTADLATRLGLEAAAVAVAAAGDTEVQLGAPCGTTAKQESGPLPGGLSVGYQVVLAAAGRQYRYVAVGGLAYYCAVP